MSSRARRLAKTRRMQRTRRSIRAATRRGDLTSGLLDFSLPASQTNTVGWIYDLPEKWWHTGRALRVSGLNRKAP